ncbi:GNAT family N-acetyltransferase [Thalassobacillus hwangdonensis]|uniref:GNAT family N-acetyltransferase n=1 Tax=Thalassobacillus hwangdonensis TaxID=546108 RepID=A0ABW3KVB7_9BACI
MSVTIRNANEKDLSDIIQVARKSWHATYQGIIPVAIQNRFLDMAYSDQQMKRRLDGSYLYVAEVDGGIVGFANFSPVKEGGEVELGAIYLLPDQQGQGAGTLLLQKGIADIPEIKTVYINVEKENQTGLLFYKAKGFQLVDEFDDDFDGHILKTIRMVLKVK